MTRFRLQYISRLWIRCVYVVILDVASPLGEGRLIRSHNCDLALEGTRLLSARVPWGAVSGQTPQHRALIDLEVVLIRLGHATLGFHQS